MSNRIGTSTCVICENSPLIIPECRTCQAISCRLEYQQWLLNRKPVCAVCGRRLETAFATSPVCSRSECSIRWNSLGKADSVSPMARCSSCGVYTIHQSGTVCLCNDPGCRLVQSMAARAERQRIENEMFREMTVTAEAIRDRLARENGEPEKSRYAVALIPHISETMALPNNETIAMFCENLDELIRAAIHDPAKESDWPERTRELPDPAKKSELPVLGQACAACRGKCCREGSHHAYLGVGNIRDYRTKHPEASGEDIKLAYWSHLPPLSLTGSCVFHTDQGCNLPREMRSEVCNRYICRSLRAIRASFEANAEGFFIVSEQDGTFHDVRFVASPKNREALTTARTT